MNVVTAMSIPTGRQTRAEKLTNDAQESINSWSELLDTHLQVLKDHLEIWDSLRNRVSPGSPYYEEAQKCVDDTRAMIESFQTMKTSMNHESLHDLNSTRSKTTTHQKGDPVNVKANTSVKNQAITTQATTRSNTQNDPIAHKTQTAKPVKDISQLFTIDTNPTPLEQLQNSKVGKRAEKTLKRKLSQSSLHPLGVPTPLQETIQLPKRAKHDSAPGTINTTSALRDSVIDKDSADDSSFAAKVQREHYEQESKRKKKLDKKRKRESNTSAEGQDHDIPELTRSSKKKKVKSKAEEIIPPAKPEHTKKRKSGAADDVMSSAQIVGKSMKKKKPKKS